MLQKGQKRATKSARRVRTKQRRALQRAENQPRRLARRALQETCPHTVGTRTQRLPDAKGRLVMKTLCCRCSKVRDSTAVAA